MDLLYVSKYFVVLALIIMMFAALRTGAYKSNSMGLLGSSVAVIAFAIALVFVGNIYNISFCFDIALALIFFGFVGTVAFSMTMGGDN